MRSASRNYLEFSSGLQERRISLCFGASPVRSLQTHLNTHKAAYNIHVSLGFTLAYRNVKLSLLANNFHGLKIPHCGFQEQRGDLSSISMQHHTWAWSRELSRWISKTCLQSWVFEGLAVMPPLQKNSMLINSGYRFLAILKWQISVRYEISFLAVLRVESILEQHFKRLFTYKEVGMEWPCWSHFFKNCFYLQPFILCYCHMRFGVKGYTCNRAAKASLERSPAARLPALVVWLKVRAESTPMILCIF